MLFPPQIQASTAAVVGPVGRGSSMVQEVSEVKWGALLGGGALTTNQPYFSTVVATGEWGHTWLLRSCIHSYGAAVISVSRLWSLRY
jgi:hypothetical protein